MIEIIVYLYDKEWSTSLADRGYELQSSGDTEEKG